MTPTRTALLGLGLVAEQIHLPACALVPELDLVAGCDPRPERRELARLRGVQAVYEDAEALLAKERPELVIIATPPNSHRDLCLLSLRQGAHVLCEKPFVRSVAEADEVIAAAERGGQSVAVNNQYRYLNTYREAREALARGKFGRPYLIQAWQQMHHLPYKEKNWRGNLVQSTLYEFGSHPLDLFSYFFDALPESITAHAPKVRGDTEADVLVQATLRFPGDRLATLLMNRVSHAPGRYLEMRVDCERASLRLSFGGVARFAVDWSRKAGRPVFRASLVKGGEARVEQGGRSRVLARDRREARAAATAALLREMIAGIRAGRMSLDPVRHARELTRTVFAGYESARLGETVRLSEFPK